MIAEAKSDYESRLALDYAHTNNNKIFEYISNIKGCEHFPTKISYNDDHAFTDPDKAQLFNKYFYSVFTTSSSILYKRIKYNLALLCYMKFSSLNLMFLPC